MLKTLGEDYIEMARAKGLKQRAILRHAFRNSILPVFTLFITEIGFILGGMMLIEVTFDWPGMGRLIFYSAATQDFPLAMGSLFIIGMVIILMNYIGDISYGFLDPRLVYD